MSFWRWAYHWFLAMQAHPQSLTWLIIRYHRKIEVRRLEFKSYYLCEPEFLLLKNGNSNTRPSSTYYFTVVLWRLQMRRYIENDLKRDQNYKNAKLYYYKKYHRMAKSVWRSVFHKYYHKTKKFPNYMITLKRNCFSAL